jgi:hypothetical protein
VTRQYYPIWERIKTTGSARLKCAPGFVARVKKAVIKEKDMDVGYKLMNEEDPCRLEVSYNRSSQVLTFKLVQTYGFEERIVV